jgi:hypothetical protein
MQFGSTAVDSAGGCPEHGAVTVKRATFKATNFQQCLAVEAPAFVAFYRADRNFDGADRFELEIDFPEVSTFSRQCL